MKKRLHDKKAGIALLLTLIVISVAEVIFRAVVVGEAVLTTSNLGEQLAVIALAVTVLILTAKGKDRACYLCLGAWLGYFALDQLFELPGTIITFTADAVKYNLPITGYTGPVCQIISMAAVVALGVLLVEYMNDGTICNRAFNIVSVIAILALVVATVGGITVIAWSPAKGADNGFMSAMMKNIVLALFNNVYRLTMVFLFTFFAYDSAKHQLKKTDLSK